MAKHVISLRIDEELYERLREFPDYPEKIREYIKKFINRAETEMNTIIENYLNEFLKGRKVDSPVYRCISLKVYNSYESVDRQTIKRYIDYSGEMELVANLIDEKWEKIVKKYPQNISYLIQMLKNSFYNREDYSKYLKWMKNEISKIEQDEPELFHIVGDFIHEQKLLMSDDEYIRKKVLDQIYGDGKYENIINRFFTCGSAQYHYANKWSGIKFDDNAREYIENIRKEREESKREQMEKELNDELFDLIGNFYNPDSSVYERYKKENKFDEKSIKDVSRLIKDHWILFDHSNTYLSLTSMNLMKTYALKRI